MTTKQIDVHSFQTILAKDLGDADVDFINVCTIPEYNEKHIPGVRNVPLDTLEQHMHEFTDKKTIYIHCRSGVRGQQAVEKLAQLDVTAELINVTGGIIAWSNAGFATTANTSRKLLMHQVLLITAGVLIALGILLALLVHPN